MILDEGIYGDASLASRFFRINASIEGDDIVQIVVDTALNAAKVEGYEIQDKDIITVTESVVARSQGNYATIDQIAADIKGKFGDDTVGVIFPILSRNRFSNILRGIARGAKKIDPK